MLTGPVSRSEPQHERPGSQTRGAADGQHGDVVVPAVGVREREGVLVQGPGQFGGSFLEEVLPGRHRLSVMNIVEHVQTACADQVVASPTLLRVSPLPQRRFIGDLSDTARLRRSLGLPALMGG